MKRDNWILFFVCAAYLILAVLTLNNCYFWDNVQQTSKEAYWFYTHNFSSLMLPSFSDGGEIVSTGYHPPLTGILTALLWKVFGMHVWVSHVFILIWALLLAYNTFRLLKHLLPASLVALVMLVPLFDSTVLSQIAMASPDIILLSAFVMSLRFIIEKKTGLLALSLIFLGLVNGRGMFAIAILYIFNVVEALFTDNEKFTINTLIKRALPFIPVASLLIAYFITYFSSNGWFLTDPRSPWAGGWKSPEGIGEYVKNFIAFCLRILENGRFVIWIATLWCIAILIRSRQMLKGREFSLAVLAFLFLVLYLYFAMTTKIAISSRYNMPFTFAVTVLTFIILSRLISTQKVRTIAIIAIIMAIAGNFWIYPDKISKAWDATLGHLPYYQLRQQCLDYIEEQHINHDDVSGGFCFSGNQRYIDLKDRDYRIGETADTRYFIYSNISNIDDTLVDELTNGERWKVIKTFKKGFVFVSLLEKIN
jgi:hypothetical protein